MRTFFYHNPKFAILDECTLQLVLMRVLYRAANERGITSITISQRLALEEFHTRELRWVIVKEKGEYSYD